VEPRRCQGVWAVPLQGQGLARASRSRPGVMGRCARQSSPDMRQQALLLPCASGGGIVMCQFCGHRLSGTRAVSCSERDCLRAAKRARSRARKAADRNPDGRPLRTRRSDGRTMEFPPELDYLDRDPGITAEQMAAARHDPGLRRMILARRANRTTRLQERLKALQAGLST